METPKEKALSMIEEFTEWTPAEEEFEFPYAIECTRIAVKEIIEQYKHCNEVVLQFGITFNPQIQYWEHVIKELNKL